MNIFSSQFTPLQALIIISGVVFFLFAIDALQRRRFNGLHFLVFFGGISIIILFALNIGLLNKLGSFFGVNRGADLLVYVSIILLAYFYFEILNKVTRQSFLTTRIISEQAITNYISNQDINNFELKKDKYSNYLFLIRAYNEGTTLPGVIDEIVEKGFSKILVVNDGSIDNSSCVVQDKQKQHKKSLIILLNHLINRGGGAANKTGFEFLKKYGDVLNIKWIVTYDADGQMNIADISNFIKFIDSDKSIDILLGTRFIEGGKALNIPKLRRLVLAGSKIVTYVFNGLWVTDPHNGYRVISLDSIRKMKIVSDGMIYASELLEEVYRLSLNYKEVPVNIIYTEYSLNKGQKNGNAIKIFLGLIYNKFFYK